MKAISIIKKRKAKLEHSEKILTCNKKRLPHVLEKEQLLAIIDAVDDIRLAMIIYIGIFQGLRIGEIINLRWQDVDLDNGELLILDAKNTKRFKSGYGKDRIVPVNEMFIPVWKSWKLMTKEEYVIPDKKKRERSMKTLRKLFQSQLWRALDKVGLLIVNYDLDNGQPRYKYHMHTLRHVCGTNLRRAGMKIEDIRDFLGHEDVESSMIYAELTKDDLKEVSHIAYSYPKSRIGLPQPPAIEISVDKGTLQMQKQILEMQLQLANIKSRPKGVIYGNMPQ